MLVVFGRDKEPRPLEMMMDRFLKIYPRLIQKFGNRIDRIDMRYANGMAVHLKGSARPDDKAAGDKEAADREAEQVADGTQ